MFANFHSLTYGDLTLLEVKQKVIDFMAKNPDSLYRLVIGSDSQAKNGGVDFVTALVVHRVGFGGVYFWQRIIEKKKYVLRDRIYQEAGLSLEFADQFLKIMNGNGITKFDVEIHVDIGKIGETREMISEIVGMVRGNGYEVKTKPESYGASKVADRHT